MNGDEIDSNEVYPYVSLGISIGSRLNRFAVCKFLLIPLPVDPERIVYLVASVEV